MTPAEHVKAIEDAAMAYASTASECARRGLVTPDQCWKSLKAAIIAGVGAAPEGWMPIETAPKDGSSVLLRSQDKHMADGYWLAGAYNGNGAWIWPYVNRTPQYWMLLPPSPKP